MSNDQISPLVPSRETTIRKRRRLGLCVTCGEDRRGTGLSTCPVCTETEKTRRLGRKDQIRQSSLARAASREAAGVCVRCGIATADDGTWCVACRSKDREQHAIREVARAKDYAATGRCTKCGKVCDSATKLCLACLKESRIRGEEYRKREGNVTYQSRRANGLCVTCASPLPVGHATVRCPVCAADEKANRKDYAGVIRADRKAKGLCPECGKEPNVDGGSLCSSCRLRSREAGLRHYHKTIKAKVEAGGCKCCNKPRWGISTMCQYHAIDASVRDFTQDKDLREELIEHLTDLYTVQGGLCAYTGLKLEPGKSLSVEHIFPKCRFPMLATEPSNLVWVDSTVNTAKLNRSPDDSVLDTFMLPTVLMRLRELASKVVRPQ